MSQPRRRQGLFGEQPRQRAADRPLTPTEINALVCEHLEEVFGSIAVQGEISNLKRAASGHLYFTLKDERAQLDVVMWRSAAMIARAAPRDGMEVVARGKLTLYQARGRFQLVAHSLTSVGDGDLEARREQLRRELAAAGWFDESEKKPIPDLPRCIGVATSAEGAAIHDILRTIRRRFSRAWILIAPTRVQGAGAAREIAAAVRRLDEHPACDVIIVGRGGGSLEDLWAFNERLVLEAIRGAKTPIISAVGHETDVTLADLVADARALTPTDAGTRAIIDETELAARLGDFGHRLGRAIDRRLERARSRLGHVRNSWALRQPKSLVQRARSRLADVRGRLERALGAGIRRKRSRVESIARRLVAAEPSRAIERRRARLVNRRAALDAAWTGKLATARHRLERLRIRLEAASPLAILARGYSITLDETGRVVTSAAEVENDAEIVTMLHAGVLRSRVIESESASSAEDESRDAEDRE